MGIFDGLLGKNAPVRKNDRIQELIARTGLRPLGNRKRLGFVEGKDCLDYRAQFRDRASLERYYAAFLKHAERSPPPFLIEVMAAYTPNTIYPEKYAFILPYFGGGAPADYRQWAKQAISSCNGAVRQHRDCEGNSYGNVPASIGAKGAVIGWAILPPGGFNPDSGEARELLSDPPGMGFSAVIVEGEGTAVPEKPDPRGPWIGVLFEISKFDEALYGRAATKQLLGIVGPERLAGTIIHGGDLPLDNRYWCNAIHASSPEQAALIESAVAGSGDGKLARDTAPVLRGQQVPVNALPFQGFVSGEGVYVGS